MQSQEIRVWDPLVRIFHWTLVAAFAIAYLTEDDLQTVHVYAGYTVGGLLLFRLLWGVVGTRHARFSDFVRPPAEVFAYLKSLATTHPRRYLGHNPAGGAMIVLLLISLASTVITGLAGYGAEGHGPLGASLWTLGVHGEEAFEEIHEFFANATLLLVFLHVTGVVVSSRLHDENLVRAMVTGRKRVEAEE